MIPQNILIIGNSHTAAPRIALRDDPARWPGFQPEVFAMPGDMLADLELKAGALVPKTDDVRSKMEYYNGITALPLSGYDGFAVIGGLGFHRLVWPASTHPAGDFPSVLRGEAQAAVSTGFIDAVMAHRIATSPALRLIRGLSGLGQGPVLFIDQVLPSADCRADPGNFAGLVSLAAQGDAGPLRQRYLRHLGVALDGHARHLPQPEDSLQDQVFTAPEWMRGSIRMQPRRDVPHELNEYGHANPAYGARQVDLLARAFGL